MKPLLTGSEKRPKAAGAEAAVSLQEELVAAIHGAFKVAVEIAVREVTKLVGQATGDVCEDMRRENESLKQRLQRAEALLDSAGREQRGGGSHTKQLLNATKNPPPHMNCSQRSPDHKVGSVHSYTGVRDHSRAQQPPDPQHDPEEQRSAAGEPQQPGGEAAAETGGGDGGDAVAKEVSGKVSSVPLRVESINQPCRELAADRNSPPLPTEDDESTLKQVTVKQENTEEEGDDSACCLDSIKVEDFSPEQDRWIPEVLDLQSQDSNTPLTCTSLAQEHISLSTPEGLLDAVAGDNSEVDNSSDCDTDDTGVDHLSEEDYISPYSPESDGQSSADSNSEPQLHPNASTRVPRSRGRVRKRQCGESFDIADDESGPSKYGRGEFWKSGAFTRSEAIDEREQERKDWQPLDYLEQYIDAELMKHIANCTNATSFANSSGYLSTSADEIYHFFGASILMSCVPYPQMRMFWSNALQIPAISDKIGRERFFKLRNHLKVVIDDGIPENMRKADRFWKMRPFMDRIRKGCLLQARPDCVWVDEQMIPFTGACPFRQYVPLKPKQVGMRNFVLASVDGVVLDFEVYQGANSLRSQVQEAEGLGLGALVIERLARTLHPGTKVNCDRFFKTKEAQRLEKQVKLKSSVTKDLQSDQTTKQQGRGASASDTKGGVDLVDRMMRYYKMSFRSKRWTIRMLMHFTDLALANSWLLYSQDNTQGTPRKDMMQFLEFRMTVAQAYLTKCDGDHVQEENAHLWQHSRKHQVTPVPHVSVRTTSAAHLPEMVKLKNSMRCREKGCSMKSRVRCGTCNVFLCLKTERNCYAAFHKGQKL